MNKEWLISGLWLALLVVLVGVGIVWDRSQAEPCESTDPNEASPHPLVELLLPRDALEPNKVLDRTRKNKLGGMDYEYLEQLVKTGGPLTLTLTTPAGTNVITDNLPALAVGKVHRIEVRIRVAALDANAISIRGE